MGKDGNNGNENEVENQPYLQIQGSEENVQSENYQENTAPPNMDMMGDAMKDLQQKISNAKNSTEKGQIIQNGVFEMLQNMGLKIPPEVMDGIKNMGGKK